MSTNRIEKKLNQIQKIKNRISKWESKKNEESFYKEYQYFGYTKEETIKRWYEEWLGGCDEEIRRAKRDLEEAEAQLERIHQMLAKQESKQDTLSKLPQCIIDFKESLITKWDAWDINMRETIRQEYKQAYELYKEGKKEEYHEAWLEIKYKYKHIEPRVYGKTDEEIHKENIKDAEDIILSMVNRIWPITGDITDAKHLYLNYDNNGFTIINGTIIGEKGKANIHSIGAGGYNVQRYHIRVLVKEAR